MTGPRVGTPRVHTFATLSPREKQVFMALIAGTPVKVFARQIGIDYRSVSTSRARIYEKLEIQLKRYEHGNAALIEYAARNGIQTRAGA